MPIFRGTIKGVAIGVVIALWIVASQGRAVTQALSVPAPVVPCNVAFVSPQFFPLAGTFGAVAIDEACEHVYFTNLHANRVEDFSLRTFTFNAPIAVGAQPMGLDLRPGTSLLYVANSRGSSISVVDLVKRAEVKRISTPPSWTAESPYSIAIPSNGIALFSTNHHCCTGGRMMQLDLATEQSLPRTDFQPIFRESASAPTRLKASRNRKVVGIVDGGDSGGTVARYDAPANRFTVRYLQTFLSNVAVDSAGSAVLAVPGTFVLDAGVNLAGTVTGPSFERGGVEVSPDGRVGYRTRGSSVEVMNLTTFLTAGTLPLGDTTSDAYSRNTGLMDLSDDGRLLAVLTDHGLSIVQTRRYVFTDDPLVPGTTTIRAVHLAELRERIDAQRVRFTLPRFVWSGGLQGGATVRASDVVELRNALLQVYDHVQLAAPPFAEPLVPRATTVKAAHLTELRAAIMTLEVN